MYALDQDLRPLPPPDKTKEDILLFFKLYDPEKEELRYFLSCLWLPRFVSFTQNLTTLILFILYIRYVGRLFVKALGKPAEILTKLNEMAGLQPNEEIELYEVSSQCLI